MNITEIKRRVKSVRQHFKPQGVEAMIVIGVENVRYVTGFCGHDSWALILPHSVFLLTDSRYTEQARGECVGCKIIERKESLIKEIEAILAKARGISVVGVEDSCSVALLKRIRKGLAHKIKPVSTVVEKVRTMKTADEVKCIRKASKIAFDAMEWALGQLKVGMTELELSSLYEYRLSYYGAKIGFETIACFGANGSRNHHQPGRKKLRKHDTILLDFGANYQGYISDTTRSFAFGKVTPYFRKVYETVARAQKAGIASIKAGVKLREVDIATRAVIEPSEFPVYGHGTGHGVGLEVHELPWISKTDKKGILKAGQVLTVEPGIYLPGKLGVRLEDDVLVTETGYEIVSRDKRFDIKVDHIPLLK